MNEMKQFKGTPTEKEFFSDRENGKQYKAIRKEYKKIRFLETYSKEIGLTDAEKSIIANRKKEILGIVKYWPTDIKLRLDKDTIIDQETKPTKLMKSLPESFRYDTITLPKFDREKPKERTWEYYIDWNFFPWNKYLQSDKIMEAKKHARKHNEEELGSYDREKKEYQKQCQILKPKYDTRKNNYYDFMRSDIKDKMNYYMPTCYMKDCLQYLNELILIDERKKIEQNNKKGLRVTHNKRCENKFPYRILADVLEYGNPEQEGTSQKIKVDSSVEEAAREAEGRY